MRRPCSECGRHRHLDFSRKNGSRSHVVASNLQRLSNHDLCAKCWKSINDSLRAQRMRPKPWWAVKSSAVLSP